MKGDYWPKVAANAGWSTIEGASKVYPDGFTFTLGAELGIYAGGRRKAELTVAREELRELEHQREQIKHLVEADVRQAYIRVQNAIATIRREKSTVELGLEGRRLASLRFNEGIGTQPESLDAELALTGAQTKLVRALRDYAVAHAALNKALGQGAGVRAVKQGDE